MGGKVCLRHKGKILLVVVNKLFVFKSLLTTPSNVLLLQKAAAIQMLTTRWRVIRSDLLFFQKKFSTFLAKEKQEKMRLLQCSVPEGDLHCQCTLSIFPASVHQFYVNIFVFLNINPFLHSNDQFALNHI